MSNVSTTESKINGDGDPDDDGEHFDPFADVTPEMIDRAPTPNTDAPPVAEREADGEEVPHRRDQNGDREVLIDINAIVTNPQWFYRNNLQGIDGLAESMSGPNGQLQAIIVDPQMNLVFGARRIAAAKKLGWTQIRARVIDLSDPLAAIQDENGCRADFVPSEKVKLASMIEAEERIAAKERMKQGGVEKVSTPSEHKGRAKDRAANAVGWSRPTLEKAKAIINAARYNPVVKAIVDEMDSTGNVSAAFRQFEESGWHFKPNRNYVTEFESGGVSWMVVVAFESEQDGQTYYHTEVTEGWDREKHTCKGGSVSTRAIAGWAIYLVLKKHFLESVVKQIKWEENGENWVADYVHCIVCGGNGKGDYGNNPDAKCAYCDGNGTVSKDWSERNSSWQELLEKREKSSVA